MSADVKIVRLLLANGSIAEFPVDNITALEFTPRKAPPAPRRIRRRRRRRSPCRRERC